MRFKQSVFIKPLDFLQGSEGFFVSRVCCGVRKMKKKIVGKLTLVIGGARSGKSSYAGSLAGKCFKEPVYVATAEPFDSEMADRIARHKSSRGPKWACIEEPLDVPRALQHLPPRHDGVLLDCVTVWLCNVLVKEGGKAIRKRINELIAALENRKCDVIVVSNEVGMGIVPDNRMGREFRDYAGWLNQDLASIADAVVLVVAGIPMVIKGKKGRG